MSVGGLRKAAPSNLPVLTQDVLRRPLGQIEPATLADLLALSEIPDQLPASLAKEFSKFQPQMAREIADLPDGPGLAEFARELAQVPAEDAPACLRSAVLVLVEDRKNTDALEAIAALEEHWKSADPADIVLPDEPKPAKKAAKKAPVKAPAKRKRRTTTVVDERREEWIREDVVSRLVNYGSTGLKEPIVIAGARHRSPWSDLTEAEVLVILRRMKREGVLRLSAGRWSLIR